MIAAMPSECETRAPPAGQDPSAEVRTRQFVRLCRALDDAGVRWVVLSGYATYPEQVKGHDVDLLVEPGRFGDVGQILSEIEGVEIVQRLTHESTAVRFELLSYRGDGVPVLLAVDVCSDIRYPGVIFQRADEFLASRRRIAELFWTPSPRAEFAYYLAKKLEKCARLGREEFEDEHGVRLSALYAQDPSGCEAEISRLFSGTESDVVSAAADGGDWTPVRAEGSRFYHLMHRRVRREHPWDVVRYRAADLVRRFGRVGRPRGAMVVFLGPDGAGKSSVISGIRQSMSPQPFRRGRAFHLRPYAAPGKKFSGGVRNPHGPPPRGLITSVAKMMLWWVDYVLGYLIKVRPSLVRGGLVTFDRYFIDLLVDQRRYRYGGPMWLARLVGLSVPRPDLVVLLDAPAEVLRSRKQDISFEEAVRQRQAYRAMVERLPNGHIVDSSVPLDEVILNVQRIILRWAAGRS